MEGDKNNKNNLTIYGDYLSQPFRAIVCFCKLNKIPYDIKFINLGIGQHLSDDYKKINPFGKIPAISLDQENFKMAESCSILRFLASYYKTNEKWYPNKDPFRRALIDQWMDWHHSNSRFALSNFVFSKVFKPKLEEKGIKRETFNTDQMVGKVLGFLNKILSTRHYIADDEISIADLIIVCEINQLFLVKYDFSPYKNVENYLDRINSIQEVRIVNNIFADVAKKIKLQHSIPKANF
jgi:glutathione S-transferase